jgi:RNA polymerase sigma-70 factor (ECF subfamily)
VIRRETEWAAWMRDANAGDNAAYERLLRAVAAAMRPLVRRGLQRAGRATAEAEDVVQEILLAVHLKRHTWDPSQPISPWLYAIARYKLIDTLRRRGAHRDVPIDDVAETLPAPATGPPLPPRDMERVLAGLPAGQRQVVRTVAIDGASIAEAAARLQMTPGAVRTALHRGISAVAKALG